MNILMSTHTLSYGGSVVSCYQLGRELENRGHHVSVVAPINGPMRRRFEDAGMSVNLLPDLFSGMSTRLFCSYIKHFDLLYTSSAYCPGAMDVAYRHKTPYVVGVRGETNLQEHPGTMSEHFKRAAEVVYISEPTRQQHSKWIDGVVIPPSVDFEEIDASKMTKAEARQELGLHPTLPIVLMVAGAIPRKRVEDFCRLSKMLVNYLFIWVPGYNYVKGDEYRVRLRSILNGFVLDPRLDPLIFYRAADLLVMTSESEGGPRAVLEAAAMKLPVVSTPVGVVPGIPGVQTFEIGNLDKAEVKIRIPPSPTDVEAAYHHVREHHDLKTMAEQFEKVFQDVVE